MTNGRLAKRVLVATLAASGAVTLAAIAGAAGPAPDPAPVDGAAIFAQNCAACHQAHGQGIPGAFPALAGDAFVQGPDPQVAFLLTHGRGGMPSFADDLTDQQIAAVLTFVRSSWGNKAGAIDPAVVAAARHGAAKKDDDSVLPYH